MLFSKVWFGNPGFLTNYRFPFNILPERTCEVCMERIAQFQKHRYAIEYLTGKPKLYTTNFANKNESFITKKIFFFYKNVWRVKGGYIFRKSSINRQNNV